MVDTKKLEERIAKSGYKKQNIAAHLGITPASLRNKITNKTEFNVGEYIYLEDILNLTREESRSIFFAKKVKGDSTEVANA